MSSITYKGFRARVEFDAEDRLFVGHLAGINDVIGFHADTVDALEAAFHAAVEDYVETCRKVGREPERPYSGKVMFRISPETHAAAALAAQIRGKSLNQWAEEALGRAAHQDLDVAR